MNKYHGFFGYRYFHIEFTIDTPNKKSEVEYRVVRNSVLYFSGKFTAPNDNDAHKLVTEITKMYVDNLCANKSYEELIGAGII